MGDLWGETEQPSLRTFARKLMIATTRAALGVAGMVILIKLAALIPFSVWGDIAGLLLAGVCFVTLVSLFWPRS